MALRAAWVLESGARYWPGDSIRHIRDLELPEVAWLASRRCTLVALPEWAADLGVGAPPSLLVDQASIATGEGTPFERCNWVCAAYLFLSGCQEDPDNNASYAALLRDTDGRLFDRAWVNRILLLLRRMAAHRKGAQEEALFGVRPSADIRITHDVDAIRKTAEIRFKQTAFHVFNAGRAALRGDMSRCSTKAKQAVRFLLTTPSYWHFAAVCEMERERGYRSTFNFYGGPAGLKRRSLAQLLIDPGYDVGDNSVRQEVAQLVGGGWRIGVHPSFASWNDAELMRLEREAVETACGLPVTECRQHWLRFSWKQTWRAQQQAGFTLDTTLGFNDRPGLRNGAALSFSPWNHSAAQPLTLKALPTVLMDSHFFDYSSYSADDRRAALAHWIGEIKAVGGQCCVNWHIHTFAPDYGWGEGYIDLLDALA